MLASDGIFIVSIWQPNIRFGGFLAVNTPKINDQLQFLCKEIGALDKALNEAGFDVTNKLDAILFDSDFYDACRSDAPNQLAEWHKAIVMLERRLRNENDGQGGELGIYLCRKQSV